MNTSEPLHVAIVWHMHQPYYRSARTGAFEMPWARLHALKDYLDMVKILADYPQLHQTFNLVPSLVEQLEQYASGDFVDVYWEHTMKPAAELDETERVFIVERMCERSDHPRARLHPRYLELARKREALTSQGWRQCAAAFTEEELRDLQIWFNLAWFDPCALAAEPLSTLVAQGRGFHEEDKEVIAQVQADILARTLPAYRDAAARGQVELSTSPYFHPILPLLANTDSARVAAADIILPPRRFAHSEDAVEQVTSAVAKHERVFGAPPRGMWCSEQAVGEDIIPLLVNAGLEWTISDESVLARSLTGAAPPLDPDLPGGGTRMTGRPSAVLDPEALYTSYRLEREGSEMAIVFRDHTLSDLIGFAYQSWDSREAAADLLRRIREIQLQLRSSSGLPGSAGCSPEAMGANTSAHVSSGRSAATPLVTIALDGENAWEYYPHDGRDFLRYLYEGLSSDPSLRCVTISEHLQEAPPTRSLGWLHTGSWISGDLRTWIGDEAHNVAWDLLHSARDLAACRRRSLSGPDPERESPSAHLPVPAGACAGGTEPITGPDALSSIEVAWRHVLIAEGSDWFWWFSDHHHTELDYVWDAAFRLHLQQVYFLLDEPAPMALFLPVLQRPPAEPAAPPQAEIHPAIDGLITHDKEWEGAGLLAPDRPSTMQPSEQTAIEEVRFGWHGSRLCLIVVPKSPETLEGLDVELRVTRPGLDDDRIVRMALKERGAVEITSIRAASLGEEGTESILAAWKDVLEVSAQLDITENLKDATLGLVVRIGRQGMTEHVFHSAGLSFVRDLEPIPGEGQ